jgi:tetratricopeptide (TPR) repeat protein
MLKRIAIVALLGFIAAGCGGKAHEKNPNGDLTAVDSRDAQALNSERSKFETSEDPPINAETYFAAGQLAEAQDSPQRAIQQYQLALKKDPNHQQALFRLGSVYATCKMWPEALATWKQYMKVTKQSPQSYANLGYCQELAGKPQDAEATYKAGIAKAPTDGGIRVNYGLLLARQGRIDEATQQLGKALKPGEVHYNLGSVYEQQGDFAKATAEYQTAIKLDPTLADARARLAALRRNPANAMGRADGVE